MRARHKKKLVELAKEYREYDWCFFHENVETMLRFMYEYFESGNNVWQVDESRMEIVESLRGVLELMRDEETRGEAYKKIGEDLEMWWD